MTFAADTVFKKGNSSGSVLSGFSVDENGRLKIDSAAENPGTIYFSSTKRDRNGAARIIDGTFTYRIYEMSASDGYIDHEKAKQVKNAEELLKDHFFEITVNGITVEDSSKLSIRCDDLASIQQGIMGQYPVTISYINGETTLSSETVLEVGVEIDAKNAAGEYLNFPDTYFRNWIKESTDGVVNISGAEDGFLTKAELDAVKNLVIEGDNEHRIEINRIEGVQFFSKLKNIRVIYTTLESADLRENEELESVDFGECRNLTELKVGDVTKVNYLSILSCEQLSNFDLQKFVSVEQLRADSVGLTEIDVSHMENLQRLYVPNNQLTHIDVSQNQQLSVLYVHANQLTSLDLSKNTELTSLYCYDNYLTELDLSNNTKLEKIRAVRNALTNLDVSHLTLTNFMGNDQVLGKKQGQTEASTLTLYPDESGTAYVNRAQNATDTAVTFAKDTIFMVDSYVGTVLSDFSVDESGRLTVAAGTQNPGTVYFKSYTTDLSGKARYIAGSFVYETSDLMVSNGYIDVNEGKTLKNVQELLAYLPHEVKARSGYTVECADFAKIQAGTIGQYPVTVTYTKDGTEISRKSVVEVGVKINAANFPDDYFREYVKIFDTDQSGSNAEFLTAAELEVVEEIVLQGKTNGRLALQSIKGIEYFLNLKKLAINYTNLQSADLHRNTSLEFLDLGEDDSLTDVNLDGLTELKFLSFYGTNNGNNQLENLDVSAFEKLEHLDLTEIGLKRLNVSRMKNLQLLHVNKNALTEIDVSQNTKLEDFYVGYNQLTELDVSQNTELNALYCYDNYLTELDVSANLKLERLQCLRNEISNLDISHLKKLSNLLADNQTIEKELCLTYDTNSSSWVNTAMGHMEPIRTFYYNESNPTGFYKNKGGTVLNDFSVAADGKLHTTKAFEIVDSVYFASTLVDGNGKKWTNALNGTFSYAPQYTLSAGSVAFSETAVRTMLQSETDAENVAALAAVTGIVHSNPDLEEIKNAVTISMDADTLAALKAGTVGEYTYTVTLGAVSAQGQIKVYADSASGADTMLKIPASIELKRDYETHQAASEASIELYGNAEVTEVEVSTASAVTLTGADKKQSLTVNVYDSENQRYDGSDALVTLNSTKLKDTFRLISEDVRAIKAQKYTGTMEFYISYGNLN